MCVTISELVKFFNFILHKSENGIAVLLGTVPPPTALEIHEMRKGSVSDYGVRIDGGEDVPMAQNIIESAEDIEEIISAVGGWTEINRAFRRFREEYPEQWKFIEAHALFIKPGGLIRDGKGGMTAMLGRQYNGVTAKTQRRRSKRLLRSLAQYLLSWSYTDGYNLSYTPPKRVRTN